MKHETIIPFANCFSHNQRETDLVFVGLPDDSQSSYKRGCSQAPARLRTAYNGHCYNATTELGVDLSGKVADLGDVPSRDTWEHTAIAYRELAQSLFQSGKTPFLAGGDHAVTVPIVQAAAVLREPIQVIQIDAHADLYPEFEGNPHSHACTATRLLEMEHVHSLTQIGIRTLNERQAQVTHTFSGKLKIVHARDFVDGAIDIPEDLRIYLTIDLDALDPAYAPGVSHPVPGGLTSRQVLDFIQNLQVALIAVDVVEVNPPLDSHDRTAVLAAKLLHEAMGKTIQLR
ncbi:MAG: agmatinase [bacterium]